MVPNLTPLSVFAVIAQGTGFRLVLVHQRDDKISLALAFPTLREHTPPRRTASCCRWSQKSLLICSLMAVVISWS